MSPSTALVRFSIRLLRAHKWFKVAPPGIVIANVPAGHSQSIRTRNLTRKALLRPMAVSYKSQIGALQLADNACRWDGKSAGHYEVWFLTLNHRSSQRGIWFRYTLDSPALNVPGQPTFQVWAGVYNRAHPEENFVIRGDTSLIGPDISGGADSVVSFEHGPLFPSRSVGELESDGHRVRWDLMFPACFETHHHIPSAVIRLVKPSSFVLS